MLVKGKVLLFIGDGEGKTTAAIGHAVRAAGHGMKTAVIQFMKGRDGTGEARILPRIGSIDHYLVGPREFLIGPLNREKHRLKASEGFALAKKIVLEGKHDLLILDEILDTVEKNLLAEEELSGLIDRREKMHLIITGHRASPKLKRAADLISKITKVKHYYDIIKRPVPGLDF